MYKRQYYDLSDAVISKKNIESEQSGGGLLYEYEPGYEERNNRRKKESLEGRITSGVAAFSKDFPVLSSALSTIASPTVAFEGIDDIIQSSVKHITGESGFEQNIPKSDYELFKDISPATSAKNTIRATVSDQINSDVGKFLYGTGMSILDDLFMRSLTGGLIGSGVPAGELVGKSKKLLSAVNQVMQSGEVASNVINDARDRGATDAETLALGLISGAIEAITEGAQFDLSLIHIYAFQSFYNRTHMPKNKGKFKY